MKHLHTTVVLALAVLLVGALPALGQAATAPEADPPATQHEPKDIEFVTMKTTEGDIVILLDRVAAPFTVANILQYVDDGFYSGITFHRVISNFMIQGGGFTEDGTKKPVRAGVWNEWQNGLKNQRGTLSMARVGGQPHSGSSQFFINVVDNATLDQRQRDGAAYAVFGAVIQGMDVVDTIRNVATGQGTLGGAPRQDVPQETILINSVERLDSATLSDSAKVAVESWTRKHVASHKRMLDIKARYETAVKLLAEKGQATESGLRYAVLRPGEGATPAASDQVTVIYTGWFPGGHQFDSSLDSPQGPTSSFGLNQVIKGWTEGVALQTVGSHFVFEIPGDLAYGPRGRSGIPPNQTLIFEVELKEIKVGP